MIDPPEQLDEHDPLEEEDLDVEVEQSEPMNWPQAVTYVAFFVAIVLIWHDCVVH